MLDPKFNAAFTAFMAAAQAKSNADYAAFAGSAGLDHIAKYQPKLTAMPGKRYIRIVASDGETGNSRRSWAFVDSTNGNVLKSAGWKAPATNFARGNIYDANNGTGRVRWTGVS